MRNAPPSWERDLARMLREARERGLLDSLAEVYASFPEVTCDNCARCCFESPGLFYVEHLAAVKMLLDLEEGPREAVLRRALREVFFSWIEPERTCVFLSPSGCEIYERRPLACRLFGLVEPAQRDQAEAEARMAARREALRLELMGIRIPEAVIQRTLLSCDRVRDMNGQPVRMDADEMAARVADLDASLLPREVVLQEFCFYSLGERLCAASLGWETVEGTRLQMLARAQEGESVDDLLDELWRRARPDLALAADGGVR